MSKAIIDKHFTENIGYYKKICRTFYKNYLADDLLQEAYLKFLEVPESSIQISNDTAYLKHIGKRIILYLFSKRNRCKKHEDGSTSPLFEVVYGNIDIGLFGGWFDEDDDFTLRSKHLHHIVNSFLSNEEKQLHAKRKQDKQMDIVTREIFEGIEKEDLDTQVFVMGQIETINSISKRTGINRYSLTKSYNNKKEKLLKLIENVA